MFNGVLGSRRVRWMAAAIAGVLLAAVLGAVVIRNGSDGKGGDDGASGGTRPGTSKAAPSEAAAAPAPPGPAAPGAETGGGLALPRAGRGGGGSPTGATPPTASEGRSGTASPEPGGAVATSPEPGATDPSTPPTSPATTAPGAVDASGKRWVQVGVVSGTSNGRSPRFRLAGIDTRLVYRSDAGSLSVFLVDEVQGREATAGFAELDCEQPCAGEMILVSPAGNYHLEVDTSGGAYEVAIEEYRRPGR